MSYSRHRVKINISNDDERKTFLGGEKQKAQNKQQSYN